MFVSAHMLLVEDDAVLGRLLQRVLQTLGCHVLLAVDGDRALALLASQRFDLVSTDLHLPGAEGLAVLRAARALPQPPPVLVITGGGHASEVQAALQGGAVDYLVKPFAIPDLLQRVASYLA